MRIPCGWKYYAIRWRRVLEYPMIQANLLGPGMGVIILHYLDDFIVVGGSFMRVKGVTAKWIIKVVETGFMRSPKSKLEPKSRLE